ncbi:MAG TPA: AzlD domain-containing protein [Acidimicrobiales bacterium]|nr:AzlD domain-containing protein [Acidimicrobiales bacterium]
MTWLVILAVGAGSFMLRLGPLLVFERITLTERGDRVIRHAGTAVITALIVMTTKHSATGGSLVPTLLAVAVGIVLAARGSSMPRLLLFGSAVYFCSTIVLDLIAG